MIDYNSIIKMVSDPDNGIGKIDIKAGDAFVVICTPEAHKVMDEAYDRWCEEEEAK